MNLIERAKNILLTPKSEWQVIAAEPTTVGDLYRGYAIPLAAIGPLALFVGWMLGMGGIFRLSFMATLTQAILYYVLTLVGLLIISLIIDALAATFGGRKDRVQAMKIAVYASTPAWIAGIFHLIPALGILALLAGLYSLYLLYLALPVLMNSPAEKAVSFTISVVVCTIVVMGVIEFVTFRSGLMSLGGSGFTVMGTPGVSGSNATTVASENAAIAQMSAGLRAANEQLQASRPTVTVDPQAQAAAASTAFAAVMGGGSAQYDAVDQGILKAMLPDTLGGLPRRSIEATKGGMGALQVSKAEAHYANDQGTGINVVITDLGGTAMLPMVAAWASVEEDKETDAGYEKMGKSDGRPFHEVFNKSGPHSEYSLIVGQRFVVEAEGSGVDMDTLKQALGVVDVAKLDAMKNDGIKKLN